MVTIKAELAVPYEKARVQSDTEGMDDCCINATVRNC